jgi:glutathione S-transferase
MLTVHHLRLSQSERIVWLCEELGIAYDLVLYDRDPVTRLAPDAYRALHWTGTAPVISDGEVVLAETGAIIDYIVARHGAGQLTLAPDDPNFADYLFWYHYPNGSLMPSLMGSMSEGRFAGFMKERVDRGFTALDARLGSNPWLAGDSFTTADIMMAFPLTTMLGFVPIDLSPYPGIRAYLERVRERDGYRRAMARAEPDG